MALTKISSQVEESVWEEPEGDGAPESQRRRLRDADRGDPRVPRRRRRVRPAVLRTPGTTRIGPRTRSWAAPCPLERRSS